jgi:hypothetical protein
MDFTFWFGRWWVCIWVSKHREINLGIGDDLGEGNFGAFFIRNYRWKWFWCSVARPSMHFLTKQIERE